MEGQIAATSNPPSTRLSSALAIAREVIELCAPVIFFLALFALALATVTWLRYKETLLGPSLTIALPSTVSLRSTLCPNISPTCDMELLDAGSDYRQLLSNQAGLNSQRARFLQLHKRSAFILGAYEDFLPSARKMLFSAVAHPGAPSLNWQAMGIGQRVNQSAYYGVAFEDAENVDADVFLGAHRLFNNRLDSPRSPLERNCTPSQGQLYDSNNDVSLTVNLDDAGNLFTHAALLSHDIDPKRYECIVSNSYLPKSRSAADVVTPIVTSNFAETDNDANRIRNLLQSAVSAAGRREIILLVAVGNPFEPRVDEMFVTAGSNFSVPVALPAEPLPSERHDR